MTDDRRSRFGGVRALYDWEPDAVGAALRRYAADELARTVHIGLLDSMDTDEAPFVGLVEVADEPFKEDDEDDQAPSCSVLLLLAESREDYDDVGAEVIAALARDEGTWRRWENGRMAFEVAGRVRALLMVGRGVVSRPEDAVDFEERPEVEALPPLPTRVVVMGTATESARDLTGVDPAAALAGICRSIEAAGGPVRDTAVRVELGAWTMTGNGFVLSTELLARLARNRVSVRIEAHPHRGAYLVRAAEEGTLAEPPPATFAERMERLAEILGRVQEEPRNDQ